MDKKENENIPALNDNTRGTSLKKQDILEYKINH